MTLDTALVARLEAGERLTDADALALFESPDIVTLGALADRHRERLHGDVTWFNRNLHINATNICEATCVFCSFSRLQTGMPGAYAMSWDDAVGRLRALRGKFVTEVHIVNGLNPDLPFEYYTGLLTALKQERPDLHIKGFTAVEIHYYAGKYGMTVEQVLTRLRDAGMDSMPGGGAEIFADRARKKLCHDKVTSDGWLDIHRTAHRLGFRTNATMLFGSIETLEERVDHLRRLRDLQDETGGFQTFIPLKFHNENNRLGNVAETTGLDCWKTLAIARLYLDNFPHVKAYWPMLGIQVAQLSQAFGVSDLDGTVLEERIYHMAGASTPQGLTREELVSLVDRAGRRALERDTLYRVVAETPALLEVDEPGPAVRIGGVGYLNAWPLTSQLDPRHTLVQAVPDEVAGLLEQGAVDVALVPVAALLGDGDWRVVPGMAIGADGPVESVLLVAETPPEQWTDVLLDGESRTSAVLAQLLLNHGPLSKRVGELEIQRVARGTSVAKASGTTAAMVIGDAARELPERMAYRFDLAELWRDWTGLPFVFAVWAGRPDLDPRIGQDLRAAAAAGRAAIPANFSGADEAYLTKALRYDLDDRAWMGLRRFAALGHQHGYFVKEDLELYGPVPRPRGATLTDAIVQAAQVQRARRQGPVRWRLQGDVPEATRTLVTDLATARAARTEQVVIKAALAERLGSAVDLRQAGVTHLSLDDGGPLLTDAARLAQVRAAIAAGLEVEGAALFGRGESEAQRLGHLRQLEALGVKTVVVRTPGWRNGDSAGSGTAADWMRYACWTRLHTDLELLCPWQTEGLAVLQVALQSCVDGVEPLQAGEDWELDAWNLDRAMRDAGLEPERVGMPTPKASRSRIVLRPDRQPHAR